MRKLYVSNRFSLHMLHDVVLLKNDGLLRITPISQSQAKRYIRQHDPDDVLYLDYNTMYDLIGEEPSPLSSRVENIRIVPGDILLAVLRHGAEHKTYMIEYAGEGE